METDKLHGYTAKDWMNVVIDLLDGNSSARSIQMQTGLPLDRCNEISKMFDIATTTLYNVDVNMETDKFDLYDVSFAMVDGKLFYVAPIYQDEMLVTLEDVETGKKHKTLIGDFLECYIIKSGKTWFVQNDDGIMERHLVQFN